MVFTLNVATTPIVHVCVLYTVTLLHCTITELVYYIENTHYAYTILVTGANIDVNDLAPATELPA